MRMSSELNSGSNGKGLHSYSLSSLTLIEPLPECSVATKQNNVNFVVNILELKVLTDLSPICALKIKSTESDLGMSRINCS